MRIMIMFLCAVAIVTAVGCGSNASVRGKVTYDDGSPLEAGLMIFENDLNMARGEIQPNGTYVLGSDSKRDGLPKGEYRVYITGAVKEVGKQSDGMPLRESLIDIKFTTPAEATTVNVQKSMTYDFKVTRPAEPVTF